MKPIIFMLSSGVTYQHRSHCISFNHCHFFCLHSLDENISTTKQRHQHSRWVNKIIIDISIFKVYTIAKFTCLFTRIVQIISNARKLTLGPQFSRFQLSYSHAKHFRRNNYEVCLKCNTIDQYCIFYYFSLHRINQSMLVLMINCPRDNENA